MLVSFYRDPETEKSKVKIIKFADRIFVSEEGDLDCHREIYFKLEEGELRKFYLLTNEKALTDLEDFTDSFLDEEYSPNLRSSGEYKLINKENRLFAMDFIDEIYALPIKSIQSSKVKKCENVEIIFEHPVKGPIVFALRFSFRISGKCERLPEEKYHLKLSYFEGRDCRDACDLLDVPRREIKVVTILEMPSKKGGFDVLVHLPKGAKQPEASEKYHKSRSKLDKSGASTDQRYQFIWHFREFYDDQVGKEIGANGGHNLTIEYSLVSTAERMAILEENLLKENNDLKKELEYLKTDNVGLHKKVRTGSVLQIVGLVLGVIAIIIAIITFTK